MKTCTTATLVAATLAATATVVDGFALPHFVERSIDGNGGYMRMPIRRHDKRDYNDPEQTKQFAASQHNYVKSKWGSPDIKRRAELEKRQTIGLSNIGQDSFYVGQVGIGSPSQSFEIILDTGSSDFWVVDSSCTSSQCTGVAVFNPQQSSSYTASSTPFSITYGSGAVRGTLSTDTVSLAGYSVNQQTFAIVDQLATGTLNPPASGIMGMGFQSLATSGATPFWQVLASQGKLQDNLFTFQLARVTGATSSSTALPGGVFTLGLLDSNQYTGTPNYVPLNGNAGYWTISMDAFSINGQNNPLSSNNVAAIDTGTSLVIAPSSVASAIYAQIPGARTYGGSNSGTYAIPCSSNAQLSLSFGGQTYNINSRDMLNGALDSSGQFCLGGVLAEDLGTNAPDFIVGDTFLKNVFSIYRLNPAAVGFAALKGSNAQTAATSAANNAQTATAAVSATGPSTSVPLVPSIAPTSAGTNTATGVVQGGSGLSAPVAASTNVVSTPSLIPAGESSGSTSGAIATSAAAITAGGGGGAATSTTGPPATLTIPPYWLTTASGGGLSVVASSTAFGAGGVFSDSALLNTNLFLSQSLILCIALLLALAYL